MESDLRYADLEQARLAQVDWRRAHLQEACLRGVRTTGSLYLNEANLEKANLREADLTRAHLEGANLYEADLTGAKVTNEQLAQAPSLKGATMQDGTVHE
jgi:uncharacterized protein YjbI with pentapeptide repeats